MTIKDRTTKFEQDLDQLLTQAHEQVPGIRFAISRFRRSIEARGSVAATYWLLLTNEDPGAAFAKLTTTGDAIYWRELSVEHLVLRYDDLFAPAALNAARTRLAISEQVRKAS